MSVVAYRLRLFGHLVAEVEVESDGFELTVNPEDFEDEESIVCAGGVAGMEHLILGEAQNSPLFFRENDDAAH